MQKLELPFLKNKPEMSSLEQHKAEGVQLSRAHPSGRGVSNPPLPRSTPPTDPHPLQRKLSIKSLEDGCVNHDKPTNQALRW